MGILWENSFGVFLLLTVAIGGGAAYLAGRSLALQWRPLTRPILYTALLALAVRFFHFALFDGTLLSIQFYIVDFLVLVGAALLAYRLTRVNQMVTQYSWIYERTGPFGWREKSGK